MVRDDKWDMEWHWTGGRQQEKTGGKARDEDRVTELYGSVKFQLCNEVPGCGSDGDTGVRVKSLLTFLTRNF